MAPQKREPSAATAESNEAHVGQQQRQQASEQERRQGGASLRDDRRPTSQTSGRPLILITEPQNARPLAESGPPLCEQDESGQEDDANRQQQDGQFQEHQDEQQRETDKEEDQFEVVDGISYRIVAAVTTKRPKTPDARRHQQRSAHEDETAAAAAAAAEDEDGGRQQQGAARRRRRQSGALASSSQARPAQSQSQSQAQSNKQSQQQSRLNQMRRKSSAFVANLSAFLVPASRSSHELGAEGNLKEPPQRRRMSIYEMTKSPPPETSIEMYLNERRRSSTVSAKFVQQQLEQQSTFETNYCARQQYFKDLNARLINQDKRLLNVVANRGQMHRHSVDIAQLPLELAQANAAAARHLAQERDDELDELREDEAEAELGVQSSLAGAGAGATINQVQSSEEKPNRSRKQLASISEGKAQFAAAAAGANDEDEPPIGLGRARGGGGGRLIKKKFAQFDGQSLSCAPAPDVKIGQRVAYKEYYGNEFGTIRWIGRVPQISADWTVGVEFDNAIGEGDGSLHGRRYFIGKDCFSKFLPLSAVALVDQHVGRPEPGTMISVMSAAVRPGQMISIQRVSTVHVQHCFLNAPHRRPGAEFLAINTRLHCQCPNCGPCAHVVKPPRTQRLRTPKNATHMCQFSTYTCCGMESSEEALCTYTGNKISSLPPPGGRLSSFGLPPVGNSWIEGAGYLSTLQAEQRKLMPEEYRLGAAPEDVVPPAARSHHSHHRHRHSSEGAHHEEGAPPSHSQHRPHRKRHNRRHEKRPQSPIYSNLEAPEHESSRSSRSSSSSSSVDANSPPSAFPPVTPLSSEHQQLALVQPSQQLDKSAYDSEPEVLGSDHGAAKSARVLYRDSIENRYLFPTDDADADAIDSKLEADLEDLSQARYGHIRNGSTAARHRHRRHHQQHQHRWTRSPTAGSSRNLLVKSLRSLVSCLSSSKTPSDHDDELSQHSSNTMRIVCGPALAVDAMAANKSQPFACVRSLSCSSSPRSSLGSDSGSPLSGSWTPTAADRHRVLSPCATRNQADCCRKHDHHYEACDHHHQHHSRKQRRGHFHRHKDAFQQGQLGTPRPQAKMAEKVPAIQAAAQRHQSSSSDCGFSSASQNSTNLVAAASPPESGANLSAEAAHNRLTSAIYERIASRLVSSSSAPLTAEHLLKLRRGLFELQAQSRHTQSCCATNQLECCEQLLAELIKKSYLQPEADSSGATATPGADEMRPAAGGEPERGAETASLLRAFELKLTLSINENNKQLATPLSSGAGSSGQPAATGMETGSTNQSAANKTEGDEGAAAGDESRPEGDQQSAGQINLSFVSPGVA